MSDHDCYVNCRGRASADNRSRPGKDKTTDEIDAVVRSWLVAGSSAGCDVFVDFPRFHDKDDAPEGCNVVERIAVYGNDVGFHAGRQGSDLILHPDGFRSSRRCGNDRIHRWLTAIFNPIDELLKVSPETSCSDIRSKNHFDLAGHGALECIDPDRDAFLHVLESLFVEIAYPQKLLFVLDVI